MKPFKDHIKAYEEEFITDLKRLVACPSVRDENSIQKGAPFGKPIQKSFVAFKDIAQRCGLHISEFDGYAVHASNCESEDYIGVLGHLDVVDVQKDLWNTHPFTLCEKSGVLYGRGVSDDKGPLLASLYALRILNDLKLLKIPIRIIAGGAEETTWECMEYYFKHNRQPLWAFSPDGNFPIVNGEKGIAQFALEFKGSKTKELKISCKEKINYDCYDAEITLVSKDYIQVKTIAKNAQSIRYLGDRIQIHYEGKKVLSRNPHKGNNALFQFVEDFKEYPFREKATIHLINFFKEILLYDVYGKQLDIYTKDEQMGETTVSVMAVAWNEDEHILLLDVRYVRGISLNNIKKQLMTLGQVYGFGVNIVKHKELLYVSEDSKLIKCLQSAYKKVMHEDPALLTKGGASYARVLKRGVVFGATFGEYQTNVHMENENIPRADLIRAMEIYCEALYHLSNEI
ncbi:MAG: Sapep family Mn(2+)-dependent dipeptidase [Breznakia sp.]